MELHKTHGPTSLELMIMAKIILTIMYLASAIFQAGTAGFITEFQ